MLKRFGSSCKQDLRQIAQSVSAPSTHRRTSIILPTQLSIRCSTAAAQISCHHVRNVGHSVNTPPPKTKPTENNGHKTQNIQSQLPTELLSLTEDLFLQRPSKTAFLTCLRIIQQSPILSEHFGHPDKARQLAEAMVRTEYPHRAYRVLHLAHKFGCKLKQSAYESVAYHLAETNQWYLIPPLVSLGRRQAGRSTARLLNWRARALVEKCHYALLERVLIDFERENLRPNRITFHLLISGHIRNRNVPQARHYLRKMEEAGLPIDASTHALVLSVYRTMGPDTDVQAHAFNALLDVGTHSATAILNSLMRIHLNCHDTPGLIRVLALFDQQLLDPDLTGIPQAGSSLRNEGYPSYQKESYFAHSYASVHSILPKPSPDATTFAMLINFSASRRDLPRALRMVESMVAAGIQPNAGIAAAIVRALFSAGDEATAVRWIASMCDPERVSLSLFSPLISPRSVSDQHHTLPAGITLSIEVCNTFLKGVLSTRGLKGGLAVFRIMHASRIKPNTDTVQVVMRYLQQQMHAHPQELIRILRNLTSSTIPPTLSHLHVILAAILRHEKHRIYGTGWNVTAAKFSPNREDKPRYSTDDTSSISDSFDPTAGIKLPPEQNFRSLLRPIIQSLASRHIRSDRATHALRIKHEAVSKSDLVTAKEVFRSMVLRGMHPNEYHFSALMEGYTQSGDLAAAKLVMQSAVRCGIQANVVMFTILISGHARQGSPELAMRAFQDMVAAGVQPDPAAIDAIASAYFFVGAYRMARQVLRDLWPYAFPSELMHASLKDTAHALRALQNKSDKSSHLMTQDQRAELRRDLRRLVLIWRTMSSHRRSKSTFGLKRGHHVKQNFVKSKRSGRL